MIFYKAVGGVLVLLCSMLLAMTKNRADERKIGEIDGFLSLLEYFRSQIECFGLPVSEILARCDYDILRKCGFEGEAVPRELSELIASCDLKNEPLRAILDDFAAGFGKSYRNEEIKLCEYYISLLKKEREGAISELPQKKKLTTTLFLAGAAALVILLL